MKLFAPSALPVEPEQAWVGRALALAAGLMLFAPWWDFDGKTFTGLATFVGSVSQAATTSRRLLDDGTPDVVLGIGVLLGTRRPSIAISLLVLGALGGVFVSRRRFPRLPLLGGALVAAAGLSALTDSIAWAVVQSFHLIATTQDWGVAILVASVLSFLPLLAAGALALLLVDWRPRGYWAAAALGAAALAATPFGLATTGWGLRATAVLGGFTVFWELRAFELLVAEADDPWVEERRVPPALAGPP